MNRPAAKPAASSLKSIFLESGKRHLLITGSKKIGKTTLLRAAFPDVKYSITSTAVMTGEPHPDKIILNCGEDSALIGKYEADHMETIPEGFELGVRAIDSFIEKEAELVLVDEIGFLESSSEAYQKALIRLFDTAKVVASVRKQSTEFIDAITSREDVLLIDLDEWYGRQIKIGCIVMASGFSTRFKANKLLADFRGKPLAAHLLDKLQELPFCETAVVTRYPEIKELADSSGFKTVLHSEPALSDTIRLGVEALPEVDGYMLSVADQPYLTVETMEALITEFRYSPDKIIRIRCGDTPGNPVIFPAIFRDELRNLSGENGGRAVIKNHPEALRHLYIDDPMELFDIDTADAINK